MSNWIQSLKMENYKSKFTLPIHHTFFDDTLAEKYKPIVYSGQCLSGSPEGLYYRILSNEEELCIQYFYYWEYQECLFASHTYDYEPIFIYFKNGLASYERIVNGGHNFPFCRLHKNEIRPREGQRSDEVKSIFTKLSPEPYYPFGSNGSIETNVCYKIYPLVGNDLFFEGSHSIFGIRTCSNVFSGNRRDHIGFRFEPGLKRLDDLVLIKWYFQNNNYSNDMPFGHDIANPFHFPYIKYRSAKKR